MDDELDIIKADDVTEKPTKTDTAEKTPSETDIKHIIAKNISYCRKAKGLTQADVAIRLNYTDKAVSKWERGESIPDIIVLKRLAELYGVNLDDLTNTKLDKKKRLTIKQLITKNRLIIPCLAAGLVWLVATIAFVFLTMFTSLDRLWLAYIYAIPVSAIVLLVFNAIWGHKILSSVLVSIIIWTIPLCIVLSIPFVTSNWMLFLIPIPLQILTILWYIMRMKK